MALSKKAQRFAMFLVIPLTTVVVMWFAPTVLPDRWGMWVTLSIPILLVILLVAVPGFTLPEDYLARWSKSHGVTITSDNQRVLRRYLLHGRRFRTAGALGGYVGFTVYSMVTFNEPPFGWITATFGGYLLGAAAAEVWTLRPQAGGVRAASLAPRDITDYLPRFGVIGLRLVPVLTVLAAATLPLVRAPELTEIQPGDVVQRFGPLPHETNLASVIGWTIASVVLAVFIGATARRIVRRPQPIVSDEFVDIDDAVRSTSLHGLFGAGLAMLLGALARNLAELNMGQFQPDWVQTPVFIVMIFAGIASPFAWLYFGIDQPWVVRRGSALRAKTA